MLPSSVPSLANAWYYGLVIPNRRRTALHPLLLLGKLGKFQISYHSASERPGHPGCH